MVYLFIEWIYNMAIGIAIAGLVVSTAGVALSLSAASKARKSAREQQNLEKKAAAIENARTKASLVREGRSRVADINVAQAAGGTLGASSINQAKTAVSTNIAREQRDIDKLSAIGKQASAARTEATIGAASAAGASAVIQGVGSVVNNSFVQGLFANTPQPVAAPVATPAFNPSGVNV